MEYPFPLFGESPFFEEDELDWAMGELLHMIWEAKKADCRPEKYNQLLFYRCMQVIGCQPLQSALESINTIRSVVAS